MAAFLVPGCNRQAGPALDNSTLFNESLNEEIEGLTDTNATLPGDFTEFFVEVEKRNDSMYEVALDDVLTLAGEEFDSSKISVLGVMLGDSYESVLGRLGVPDVTMIGENKSYRNMEYSRKIGIGGKVTAITYHVENETVTQINIRKPFNKYLHGNTSFDTRKEVVFGLLGSPDYQDFLSNFKVSHYVENGVDFYMNNDKVQIISLYPPKEFKGVEYVSYMEEIAPGVFVNSTKAVLKE
ncbi:hypothetical protein JW826_03200 [Candidatus Woesearchaeota archaeon]|nr:hypothetical protein [Candidatus Woesearchaeota archaeon]